ncbi:hypothetical protein [Enhygromyxa salina]|uniref:hypothetical protein n=1 Tax=Enhygromyxa salina TaxID=215803 RepID=UPI001FD568BE|nr:hypothetical protein [Enhygromyxa salina]
MALECVELLAGSDRNEVSDLLPLPDGAFLAAGSMHVEENYRGWVARYESAAGPTWFTEVTLPGTSDVTVLDLAVDEDGGAWALATGNWLLHIDQTGSVVNSVDLDQGAGSPIDASAIESTDAGVWVAGASQGDAWLAIFNPTTNEMDNLLNEDFFGYDDEIRVIGRSQTSIAVAVTISTSPNFDDELPIVATTDILVVEYDLQGIETARTSITPDPNPTSARRALGIGADTGGQWYVGGVHVPVSAFVFSQIWLAEVRAESGWRWSSEGVADAAEFGGMVSLDEGILAVAGWYGTAEPTVTGWIGSFGRLGALAWHHDEREALGYDRYLHEVVVRGLDGRVRVASKALTPGESSLLRSCLIAM